ncbi:hypothetical protein ACQZV8_09945 [Magnetococcales bacterium HHB-1]
MMNQKKRNGRRFSCILFIMLLLPSYSQAAKEEPIGLTVGLMTYFKGLIKQQGHQCTDMQRVELQTNHKAKIFCDAWKNEFTLEQQEGRWVVSKLEPPKDKKKKQKP